MEVLPSFGKLRTGSGTGAQFFSMDHETSVRREIKKFCHKDTKLLSRKCFVDQDFVTWWQTIFLSD